MLLKEFNLDVVLLEIPQTVSSCSIHISYVNLLVSKLVESPVRVIFIWKLMIEFVCFLLYCLVGNYTDLCLRFISVISTFCGGPHVNFYWDDNFLDCSF